METAEYSTGPLLIEYLFNSRMIDQQMVSFYLTDYTGYSFADIGFMDETKLKGRSIRNSGFIWINMPKDIDILFWFNLASGIKYGDGKNEQYTFDTYIPAVYDTGTSFMLMPTEIATDVIGKLLKG
jgi:hypothetical protein